MWLWRVGDVVDVVVTIDEWADVGDEVASDEWGDVGDVVVSDKWGNVGDVVVANFKVRSEATKFLSRDRWRISGLGT
jgi:hypothetical protein